jgi:shikimate dehydrogenase
MGKPYAEVIGDPIAQSKSPLIHNFWLGKLGIDAEYRACHVRPGELADYFARKRADPEWRGCNITMPHKQAAMPFADTLSREAGRIGAINCVHEQQARLVGENTDVAGILEPLGLPERMMGQDTEGPRICVQIIGAGGAARAAGAAAARFADFAFFNRDVEKAKALAKLFGLPERLGRGLDALGPIGGAGAGPGGPPSRIVLVNASAMGMRGNPPVPVALGGYPRGTIVFDMVYDPLDTPLLAAARAAGLRTVDGLQMLVGQAAAAFRLFFGQPAPRAYDAELRALLIG